MTEWYKLSISETVARLNTAANEGLTEAEVQKRLEQYGPNELVEKGGRKPLEIIIDQIKEPMVIVLIVAALVSGLLGEFLDVVVILAIVVLNAIIGFTQEYKAEQAIRALREMAVPVVRVRRGGHLLEISAKELVPGDIVILETGNAVPADGRLLESVNLKVDESALTGESEAVEKATVPLLEDHLPVGDQHNMVFMGTNVTYGRGTAVIVATGMTTELGNIAEMLQTVEQEMTPLQKRLAHLGKNLAIAAVIIIAIVMAVGFITRDPTVPLRITLEVLFLTGISMAVAAIPEGLPAVVTITLSLGSQRMLKRNALIRKLPAVETLGSVTVICSDKTGTLTQNRMTVTVLDVLGHTAEAATLLNSKGILQDADLDVTKPPEDRTLSLLVKAAALCNDAVLEKENGTIHAIGDPTEAALIVAADQFGYDKATLEKQMPRVAEIPFSSETKRMTTIHELRIDPADPNIPGVLTPYIAFTKGAIGSIFEICDGVWTGRTEEIAPLDEELRQRVQTANDRLAAQGQRVLGVSFKLLDSLDEPVEEGQILVGLLGMIDPPRPEVKEAVATAEMAGIRPVMITGDHPLTAQHIAKELGIADNDRNITGKQLAQMSLADLETAVEDVSVFARVSPKHKLNIVDAFQGKGEVVAMTGDGVNDAPALRKADIGVAMGITGTDVSKEASDMILLDDNFATIVAAVEEGRTIYDNIVKFIKYTLSSNTGELLVMLIGPLLGMPLPLVPLQILWINLVTDGLPGLALATEDKEPGIMKRPPFKSSDSIFARGVGIQIIWVGLLMGFISLLVGYIFWLEDPDPLTGVWRTMVFTTLVLAQMGNAMAIRSNEESVFKLGFFKNRTMVIAVTTTFLLQLALIYVPFLQRIFRTQPLDAYHLIVALLASTVVFAAVEIDKWFRRRKKSTTD
ncbi:MAG TPA: cation-translocating P-type ATPase [Anaerolineae bacterium]|nr:cation-translocating P-type ATPase [Anaerolineae bacterium]HIP72578.1 cation-translocating P-type ATPase [Anaerolineae bacterium]